jgi:transcription initiation factor IIF auxiliary subunit
MIGILLSLFLTPAYAADEMRSGSVLKQDSYVFSIEEAERLKSRIEDLEKKEKLLEQYKILDSLKSQQNDLLKLSIQIKDDQIILYKDIIVEKEKQNDLIKKQKNKLFLNGAAIFGAGILFTSLSIYAADQLDDSIER